VWRLQNYNEEYTSELVSGINKDDVICEYGFASTYGRVIMQEYGIEHVKPILRPLSDLTKEIEVNGEKFVPIDFLIKNINNRISYSDNRFTDYDDGKSKNILHFYLSDICFGSIEFQDSLDILEKLYEWHFDIHGLIEKGEAININTIS